MITYSYIILRKNPHRQQAITGFHAVLNFLKINVTVLCDCTT